MVVRVLGFQSRGPGFKTTRWLDSVINLFEIDQVSARNPRDLVVKGKLSL